MNIAVIGGGASGMMAGVIAGSNGATVTLYEKNEKLGKKIYITGKGRCNCTNFCDANEFLSSIVTNSRFLYSSVNAFTPQDFVDFLNANGLRTKVERGNRVFPDSDKASDVTKTFESLLRRYNVIISLNTTVNSISVIENGVLLHTITGIVQYDKVIIATGGISYPSTGSTGDGYIFAKSISHTIVEPKPSLVGIDLLDDFGLQGVTLNNVALTVKNKGKEIYREFGEMLFTHTGISGPIVLTLSALINKVSLKDCELFLDFKPALTSEQLDLRVQRDFSELSNKIFANALFKLLPAKVSEIVVAKSCINPNKSVNQITVEERKSIVTLLKAFPLRINKLRPIEEAVVTSGGINVTEINPKTMQSKLCHNVYFVGEVLDV
ncbi:MAG: aminoacetone oxidase family FAD-binding enzyme, partial [Clostridia bacterium]